MTRSATSRSDLLRHGLRRLRPHPGGHGASSATHAEPLVALLGRTADPDLALAGLLRLAEAVDDRDELLDARRRRRGHGHAAAVGARRQPGADRPPGPAPRAVARAHRPDARAAPGRRRTPSRAGLLRRRRRRPARRRRRSRRCRSGEALDALRVEYRRVLLRLAARDLAHHVGVDDVAAELSDLAAGTLEAGLAVARAEGGGGRRLGAAGRDRDGQVRRARAQLRLRRRRDLRARAGRGRRGGGRHPGRHPARDPADAGLLRAHRRGHDLAGRRGAAARGQGRPAGPHDGRPSRLLRALGQDLGVPGAAQGPAGGRRPGARPASSSSWSRPWSGASPAATASSTTCRRCGAGSSRPSRRARPTGSSSSGSGGLRDVEFAVQLLQLVHGRGDETLRARADPRARSTALTDGRVRRPRRRRGACTRPTRSCAPSSTGSSSSSCAARTSSRPTRPPLRRLARGDGLRARTPRPRSTTSGRAGGARYAACTRSSSTARCSRPWRGCPR